MKITNNKMREILTIAALYAEKYPEIKEWQDIPEIRHRFYKEVDNFEGEILIIEMPF